MTLVPPDGSRDRRIEDRTNLWLIHPAARTLLPLAVAGHVSANVVSSIGMLLGLAGAFAYFHWISPLAATIGFVFSIAWLIADGLDGMVARATGTSSAFGRFMDGLCDHGVFGVIYVALALSINTPEAWILAVTAAITHAVQSSLYESERARFHRRIRGDAGEERPVRTRSPMERLYDWVAGSFDAMAAPFDRALRQSSHPRALGWEYREHAAPALRTMTLLSANVRVIAIYVACLAGDPAYFWWFEIAPLTLVLIITLFWHRRVEASLSRRAANGPSRLST